MLPGSVNTLSLDDSWLGGVGTSGVTRLLFARCHESVTRRGGPSVRMGRDPGGDDDRGPIDEGGESGSDSGRDFGSGCPTPSSCSLSWQFGSRNSAFSGEAWNAGVKGARMWI